VAVIKAAWSKPGSVKGMRVLQGIKEKMQG